MTFAAAYIGVWRGGRLPRRSGRGIGPWRKPEKTERELLEESAASRGKKGCRPKWLYVPWRRKESR